MSESESEEELPEIDYVRRSSRQRVENRRYAGDLLNFDVGKGSIKKKLEFSNFVGDPPPPPLKLENIQFFFFYMTRRANFFY